LVFQRKFFLRTMKNRLPDPSEICALDFKGQFPRSAISSVSATIGINWSIFSLLGVDQAARALLEKDRHEATSVRSEADIGPVALWPMPAI
jgi:hypothetical protein